MPSLREGCLQVGGALAPRARALRCVRACELTGRAPAACVCVRVRACVRLQASTLALRELVKRYAMAAFHQTTQRLAIGTVAGIVILYDLRTATKWRILQGHDGPVSAVAFAAGGDLVASFSADDRTLRWWQAGSSSLLGYFGLHGHCHKVIHVQLSADDDDALVSGCGAAAEQLAHSPPLDTSRDRLGSPSPGAASAARGSGMRLEWTSPSTVMLLGRGGKPLGFYTL